MAKDNKALKAWVARDKDGMLYLYLAKPRKSQSKWLPNIRFDFVELSRELFPEVNWEDEEPTEVTISIKLDEEHGKTRKFSFVCCWTCNHCVLDIGVNHYICSKTGKQLADRNNRFEVCKPSDCRLWTNEK